MKRIINLFKNITITMTYRELLSLDLEYQQISEKSPGIALAIRSKVHEFYKQNSVRLNSLKDRIKDVNLKYRKCDEHGNPYDCMGQPVMQEGADWKAYQIELKALLDQEVNVIIR